MNAGRHYEYFEIHSSQIAAEAAKAVHAGVERGFRDALVAQQMKWESAWSVWASRLPWQPVQTE